MRWKIKMEKTKMYVNYRSFMFCNANLRNF